MKCFQYFLVLILAFEAKGDPEIRPFQAEQNFRLLKKTMETSEDSKIFLDEGSGDYEDDDDYYDEEDYYEDYEGSGLLKTTEIENRAIATSYEVYHEDIDKNELKYKTKMRKKAAYTLNGNYKRVYGKEKEQEENESNLRAILMMRPSLDCG